MILNMVITFVRSVDRCRMTVTEGTLRKTKVNSLNSYVSLCSRTVAQRSNSNNIRYSRVLAHALFGPFGWHRVLTIYIQ